MKRFLFCTDYHGDQSDRHAEEALLEFKKIWKPDVTVFGGDLWDFRSMRRGATEEDRNTSMLLDFDAGVDFLHKLRPNVFLLGNHDNRLWYWRDRGSGIVQDCAAKLIQEIEDDCQKLSCRILPYHRQRGIYRIGRLKMLHGFGAGGIRFARSHSEWYGSCLLGHRHTIEVCSVPTLDGPRIARVTGCLCDLDMEWDQTRPTGLGQAHGWAYGFVDEHTGQYKVYQAEKLGGQWLLPTEFLNMTALRGLASCVKSSSKPSKTPSDPKPKSRKRATTRSKSGAKSTAARARRPARS